jgi:hypothetical protein
MASDATNFTRALLGQGLLLGWGDEAEAWLRSKVGERAYEDELADINREYAEFAQRRPVATLATEFAGGALPAVGAMIATPFTGGAAAPAAAAAAARSAGVLSRLAANPLVRGAVTGAGTGAVAGAGAAQPGDRMGGAQEGAIMGGIIGGTLPLAIRGGGAGYNWLRDRLAPSEDVIMKNATSRINRALGNALEGQGMSPQEAAAALAADRARGIPSTFANVDPALVDLAETAAQRSGASPRIIEGALGKQVAGSRERVYERAKSAISSDNFYDEESRMVQDLRDQASGLYDEAYAFGSVMDPRIMSALKNPKFKGFYDKAREIAETEKMAAKLRGEDTSKFDLEELYKFDRKGNIVSVNVPDVRTLDYIKRGIDATIDSGFRGQGMSTAEANALKDLRKVFVGAIDEATVDPATGMSAYKQARKVYAGDMEVLDAMRDGRTKFNGMNNKEVAKLFDKMGQAERDAFRTGAIQSIYDKIMVPSGNINSALRLIGSPEYTAKLKELFDSPDQFDLFKSALEREAQLYAQSSKILGGSATARRTSAREAFEEPSGTGAFIGDVITSVSPVGALTNLVARIARSATMTDDTAKEVSKMLMSSDPTEVAAAVKLLEDYGAKAATGAKKLSRGETGAIMGAATAVQNPPATEESPDIRAGIETRRKEIESLGGPSLADVVREKRRKREEGLNLTIDEPADLP